MIGKYGKSILAVLLAAVMFSGAAPMSCAARENTVEEETAAGTAETWADGEYEPERFLFSGGTGKVVISCPSVEIRRGEAYATIVFSSKNYPYIKVDGVEYDTEHEGNTSRAVIPVTLNAENTILGMTTAMSNPHEVEYRIFIYVPTPSEMDTPAEVRIPGLRWLSTDEPGAGGAYTVSHYEDGYALIDLAGMGRYMLLPEEAETPAGLDGDIRPIRRGAAHIYVASRELYDQLKKARLVGNVTMAGFENTVGLTFAGDGEALNAAQLLRSRCGLAILSPAFFDGRVTGREDTPAMEGLSDEDAAQLQKIYNALQELDVPVFPDGSSLAENKEESADWLELYKLILAPEEGEKEA